LSPSCVGVSHNSRRDTRTRGRGGVLSGLRVPLPAGSSCRRVPCSLSGYEQSNGERDVFPHSGRLERCVGSCRREARGQPASDHATGSNVSTHSRASACARFNRSARVQPLVPLSRARSGRRSSNSRATVAGEPLRPLPRCEPFESAPRVLQAVVATFQNFGIGPRRGRACSPSGCVPTHSPPS
jgi:hypothetical protein